MIKGGIDARGPVVIEGRVDGNLVSITKIRLLSTAIVHGTLTAPAIEIASGAIFEGDIKTLQKRAAVPIKKAA